MADLKKLKPATLIMIMLATSISACRSSPKHTHVNADKTKSPKAARATAAEVPQNSDATPRDFEKLAKEVEELRAQIVREKKRLEKLSILELSAELKETQDSEKKFDRIELILVKVPRGSSRDYVRKLTGKPNIVDGNDDWYTSDGSSEMRKMALTPRLIQDQVKASYKEGKLVDVTNYFLMRPTPAK